VPPDLMQHLTAVAQKVGQAVQRSFRPTKVGLMVAGLEVPHVHLHVVPIKSLADLDFAKADGNPDSEALDAAAERLRAALREAGHAEVAEG
jgi:histidine triad (HIT) family protein